MLAELISAPAHYAMRVSFLRFLWADVSRVHRSARPRGDHRVTDTSSTPTHHNSLFILYGALLCELCADWTLITDQHTDLYALRTCNTMAASMMKISSPAVAARTATAPCAYAAAAPKPARKPVVCRSYELLAAVGDVDAPIAVPLVA